MDEHTWTRLDFLICIVTLITVGVHKVYPNRITWLTESTPYVQTLGKRTVLMNIWKLGKLQRKYTQNLTCCIIFKSKSDACLKIWFKIWHVIKTLIQNLTRRKNFDSKSCFLVKLFYSKSCFLEKFFSSKLYFWEKIYFKIVLFRNNISPKTCFLKNIFLQNLTRCKYLNQNLTRCKKFNLEADAL